MIHPGASLRSLAYAMAQGGRVDSEQVVAAAAAGRFAAGTMRAVTPAGSVAEARDQVMAERGVDRIVLMNLSPQAQVAAEASIAAATAQRVRESGGLVDIRI